MSPGVSIIIPTYNRARLLPRSIESVLAQSHPDVRLVVVDDGSTDATPDVLRAYETNPRVHVVRHERNRGVTAALNTGLAHLPAGTQYFGVQGSDDALLPNAVAALLPVFEASGDAYSMVFGWCRDMGSGNAAGRMSQLVDRSGLVTYDDVLAGRFTGDFWHLARLDLLGDLRFEERARGGEGSVWWRFLRQRPGWVVPEVVSEVDTSGADRLSRPGYTHREAVGMMWVEQAVLDAVGDDLRRAHPRHYGASNAELAKWSALAGDRARARAAALKAVRHAPSRRSFQMLAMALAPGRLLHALGDLRSRRRGRSGGAA